MCSGLAASPPIIGLLWAVHWKAVPIQTILIDGTIVGAFYKRRTARRFQSLSGPFQYPSYMSMSVGTWWSVHDLCLTHFNRVASTAFENGIVYWLWALDDFPLWIVHDDNVFRILVSVHWKAHNFGYYVHFIYLLLEPSLIVCFKPRSTL